MIIWIEFYKKIRFDLSYVILFYSVIQFALVQISDKNSNKPPSSPTSSLDGHFNGGSGRWKLVSYVVNQPDPGNQSDTLLSCYHFALRNFPELETKSRLWKISL